MTHGGIDAPDYNFRRLRRLKLDYVRGLRYRTLVSSQIYFPFFGTDLPCGSRFAESQ